MARLNYQLDNANESGQEVISHLQETAQDPSPVVNKVDGINSQWNELQGKLQELRNHVIDQVSQEKAFLVFFFFLSCVQSLKCFRSVLPAARLPAVFQVVYVTVTLFVSSCRVRHVCMAPIHGNVSCKTSFR